MYDCQLRWEDKNVLIFYKFKIKYSSTQFFWTPWDLERSIFWKIMIFERNYHSISYIVVKTDMSYILDSTIFAPTITIVIHQTDHKYNQGLSHRHKYNNR